MVEGGTKPESEEKPSELGTGEGAGESLELTLSPSEPEHSFASFTLKSMKQKKKNKRCFSGFLYTFSSICLLVMPLPVELLHFKEKQAINSEMEKLSLNILSFLPQYFVFPNDSQ